MKLKHLKLPPQAYPPRISFTLTNESIVSDYLTDNIISSTEYPGKKDDAKQHPDNASFEFL